MRNSVLLAIVPFVAVAALADVSNPGLDVKNCGFKLPVLASKVEPPPTCVWHESFELTFPPAGWEVLSLTGHTGNETWHHSGEHSDGWYSAACDWDPNLITQDNWLVTPTFTATDGMVLHGDTMGLVEYGANNYDVEAWIVRGDLGGTDDEYVGLLDAVWPADWVWAEFCFDLGPLLTTGEAFKLGFRYEGRNGADAFIDNLCLTPEPTAAVLLVLGSLVLRRRR